jgi:outer membrane protein assembly factor BamB
MHGNVLDIERAWYRSLCRLPEATNGVSLLVRGTLKGGVVGRDLDLELLRLGGEWMPGRAWCPAIDSTAHRAVATNLVLTGDLAKGTLAGTVSLDLAWGPEWRMLLDKAESLMNRFATVPVSAQIKLDIVQGAIGGSFVLTPAPFPAGDGGEAAPNALQKRQGTVSGTIVAVREAPLPWRTAPSAVWRAQSPEGLYLAACSLEDQAGRMYRDVRATEIAGMLGVPFREAFGQTVSQSVRRPPLGGTAAAPGRPGGGTKSKADEDVPDLLGDGGGDAGGEAAKSKTGKAAKDDSSAAVLAGMDAIARRIAFIRALIEANEANLGKPRVLPRGEMDPGDPDFGPWFGNEFLSDSPDKPNALPANAGADGPQNWPSIARWQLMGPFPITRHDIVVQGLPDLAPCDDAPFVLEMNRLFLRAKYAFPDHTGWTDWPPDRIFGLVLPLRAGQSAVVGTWYRDHEAEAWARIPGYAGARSNVKHWATGNSHATYYARAEIHAPAAVELWAGFSVVERGQLWLNGAPLWFGPAQPLPWSMDNLAMTRLPFHAGRNTLVLRFDADDISHSAWLRICVQGRPRPPDEVKASQEAIAKARATMPTSGQQGRGWLGDGTGVYPGTHPPVAWDIKKKTNVLWHKPLPYWGNASPCMAADRMFVTMEPMTLVCLAKDDGRVLWERQVSPIDLMDEPERTRGHELYRAWWTARQEVDDLPGSWKSPGGWIGRSWPWFWKEDRTPPVDERVGSSKEMLALLDKRDALTKAEDITAVQEQLTAVNNEIEALRKKESLSSPEAEAAASKVQRLSDAWRALLGHINSRPRPGDKTRMSAQDGYWQDYDGYAFATPVTDGKHVWWKNGSGAAACFDMDGNRRWLVSTKGAGHGCASISSLLLVDGKLILFLPNRGMRLVALDPATGRELWESAPVRPAGWNASTPAALSLTNGRERMSVLVTAGGTLVRVDDGKILLTDLGANSPEGAIVPWQDRVHLCYNSKQTGRLIMVDRDQVGCQRLWCLDIPRDLCNYMGVFQAGGYACRVAGAMPGFSGTCAALIESRTGKIVDSIQLSGLGANGASVWSLFAVSDDNVYAVYGDHMFNTVNGPPMYCTVFPPKPCMAVLARNAVDRMYGAPVIDGDRIYMRGYFGVYCIGYTGDAGRAYEARTVADTLLDEVNHSVPPAASAAPLAVKPAGSGGNPLTSALAPTVWSFAGPFALGSGDKVAASLGLPGRGAGAKGSDGVVVVRMPYKDLNRQETGAKGSDGVTEREFVSLSRANVTAKDLWRWDFNDDLTSRLRDRRVLELGRILGDKAPCLVYVATTVSIDRSGVWRLELSPLQARAWLNGQPVADQDRVSLEPGSYQLVMEVTIAKAGYPVPLSPRFWTSDDPVAERKCWVDFASRYRSWFERAIELAPESDEAKRSRAVIDQLK